MRKFFNNYSWIVAATLLIAAIPILWFGYTSGIFTAMEELVPMRLLIGCIKYVVLFAFAVSMNAQAYAIRLRMIRRRGVVAVSAAISLVLIICSHWILPNDTFIVVANLMIMLSNLLVFQYERKKKKK